MSHAVNIGNVTVGGGERIAVQTMCNTSTCDVEASVAQIKAAAEAGADIIRLTTQGIKEVEALAEIKRRLRAEGFGIPLVADIHFRSSVAMAAASVADKVRINPGNFAPDFEKAASEFRKLLAICREHGTAIRIGLNHGSLGKRIIDRFGDTPEGMKEAVMEWLDIAAQENFRDIVVSLKASNTLIMSEAYRLAYRAMEEKGYCYPVHLGVTEAGNGLSGRIKSAVGTAAVLRDGIGDTIRISLTESPVNEIAPGKQIADHFDRIRKGIDRPHDPSQPAFYRCGSIEEMATEAACDFGPALLYREIDDFSFSGEMTSDGKCETVGKDTIDMIRDEIMQAARRRFTKPEYVACPGCGRTLYDIEKTFGEVKKRTSHLKGMTIAVMGCIVNGPGEMADAHYGYVGEARGKVAIYRGKIPVLRGIPQEEAIDRLLEIIEEDQKQTTTK